jgi:hypothetical protein
LAEYIKIRKRLVFRGFRATMPTSYMSEIAARNVSCTCSASMPPT